MTTDSVLERIVDVVTGGEDVEDLVRPFLRIVESLTGLESTYLTTVDLEHGVQTVLFAHNTGTLNLHEGLKADWGDTLCRRSIEEGCAYTDEVPSRWGDSRGGRELGISTYLGVPIRVGNGELYGTLCGVSRAKLPVTGNVRKLLDLFGHIIARQIERERLLERLQRENIEYEGHALTDPLTGVPNRRALLRELQRALSDSERSGATVYVAFIDLDGFKAINDRHGHDAGDRFLIAVARALSAGLREGDFLGRYGGDEFIVFGTDYGGDAADNRCLFQARLAGLTAGAFPLESVTVEYSGASVGVIAANHQSGTCDEVIAQADAAMYEVKQARRAAR
ncbi:sensor domain-containing diguanylate cyclase [Halofilum ochraceum]|uniref:sensor domain-containing diguanylate cyclase n=1 Tax=Halofilum ochraceum TaxID=1611323 RepID=UPI0009F16ECC|nr:sensor domain-containing diguanylate cyclase [Halofilum ochraceum]